MGVIGICEDGAEFFVPGFIESLDGFSVVSLSRCDDQILVLDDSAVFEDDLAVFRLILVNAYKVGMCVVFRDEALGGCGHVFLEDTKLSNTNLLSLLVEGSFGVEI